MFQIAKLIILIFSISCFSQETNQVVYKQIDTLALRMDIIHPEDYDSSLTYPAIVFFHGGGWRRGSTSQFIPHAEYFSKRGLFCFLPEYRVSSKHQTTPWEAVKDAKSAMRYIRKNAHEFRINPDKIVASGGSAGGHLAAVTALIDPFNDEADDLSISCKPNALVLFNPVIDCSPEVFSKRIGEGYVKISPIHNIREGAPPTIIFLGTMDKIIPVETASTYQSTMEKAGSRCDLVLYEGQKHGFFNVKYPEYFKRTVLVADSFLVSIGYLKGEPITKVFE